MNRQEIMEGLRSGDVTPQEAHEALAVLQAQNPNPVPPRTESLPVTARPVRRETHSQPKRELAPTRPGGLPAAGSLNIADIQASDRKALAQVRSNLAFEIERRSTRHEYQRQFVEESARHAIALPAVGLLGIADGALEAVGFGLSEIAETLSYTVVRTVRRFKEGVERGLRQ